MEDLLDLIVHNCDTIDYLPNNYLKITPNMTLLANICSLTTFIFFLGNTLDLYSFQDFINRKIEIGETEILNKYNYTINIDNRIADTFSKSQMVPGNNSVSFHN